MEDNYSPRDYGDETGLLWLCNYLYSEKVEIYGSFELITENYFAIGLSERYGAIKRATTKKCSTLRLLTPAKKIRATLFVARQVRTWAVKRATSLFNSFCNNVRNQLHIFVARLCINRSTSVSPGLHVWNLWKTYEMLRRPPIYTVNHLLLFIIAVIKFWRFAEYW